MPPVDPFTQPLSTKILKSICKWADTNRDGKLVNSELDKGRERLGNMKLSASQKQWYQQRHREAPENYLAAFGQYLEAVRAGQKPDYSHGGPPGLAFSIQSIDQMAGYDGNAFNVSSTDWHHDDGMLY
jgi:hypothetical protein